LVEMSFEGLLYWRRGVGSGVV
jgi:molybdenum-dependent DNA-binding transcriptional regulator ModE